MSKLYYINITTEEVKIAGRK